LIANTSPLSPGSHAPAWEPVPYAFHVRQIGARETDKSWISPSIPLTVNGRLDPSFGVIGIQKDLKKGLKK